MFIGLQGDGKNWKARGRERGKPITNSDLPIHPGPGFPAMLTMDGKVYLLRAMVNETANPPVVVTVYRTSKIEKYWSQQ